MKTITITNRAGKSWPAVYTVTGDASAQLVSITSRSTIQVVIAKISGEYYIAAPDYRVAIPPIRSLGESFWIREKLTLCDMPEVDAITVAQVLDDLGDF